MESSLQGYAKYLHVLPRLKIGTKELITLTYHHQGIRYSME